MTHMHEIPRAINYLRACGLALLVFVGAMSTAASARELIALTPEVWATVQGMAEEARKKHPTSPTEAYHTFSATFNGHFGDLRPAAASLLLSDALEVELVTPINRVRAAFAMALSRLEPFPDAQEYVNQPALIALMVHPKRMDAANISRVVVFRDGTEVAITSNIAPKEFTNRLGAKTSLGAGAVLLRADDLAAGATVKIVAITSGSPLEWTLTTADLATLR